MRGPRWARKLAFALFYSLPAPARRGVVRLAKGRHVVGSVALVRDAEAAAPGRLLLLRQPPGVGWSLPAGLMGRGESPAVTCARELREETGIEVPVERLRPAVPNAVMHGTRPWLDFVYEVEVPASEIELRVDGAEVLEAAFHPVDNLPPLRPATARLLSHYGIGPYVPYPEIRA